jgi:eukaryotic-like serine/threonine-protein kinase
VTPERWRRVKELFEAALEREPTTRPAFLAEAAADDPTLAEAVLGLLASHERADGFLSGRPASEGSAAAGTPDEPPASLEGRRLGSYRLLAEIGHGGMGAVYRAVRDDNQYSKQVAVKLIVGGWESAFTHTRFKTERQILANLEHANIARLLDGGTSEEGWPYLVMEYVEGQPIDRYCDAHGLGTAERLELFCIVCSAVQHAHRSLVVHRDIKPGNILVTVDGTPKLLDFGIAKLVDPALADGSPATLTGFPLMTPAYASPEQVRGEPITTASDVYSLGVLLYELLTGVRPYEVTGRSPGEILKAVCETDPARPSAAARRRSDATRQATRDLEGDLDAIILKALGKETDRRYGSAEELSEDIQRHLGGRPVRARKDSPAYRARKFVRRHKLAVAGAAAAMIGLLALTGVAVRQARIARAERVRAERRFNDVRQLADSFLFEFHDAIKDLPGATPARELVVKKALQYLDGLAREAAGDRSLLRELAAAYDKVGDVQGQIYQANLGATKEARASYQKAVALRESLAAADPKDRQLRRDLSASYTKIGDMLWLRGDPAGAADMTRRALAIDEGLAAEEPSSSSARERLASTYSTLGLREGASGDAARGLESCRKALTLFEALTTAAPSDVAVRGELADTYRRIGDILEGAVRDRPAALEAYRKTLDIDESLAAASSTNATLRYHLMADHFNIGDVQARMGDRTAALASYGRAVMLLEPMAAADPANGQYRSALGSVYQRFGAMEAEVGDVDAALTHLRKALAIHEAVRAADPSNAISQAFIADSAAGLGNAYSRLASTAATSRRDRIRYLMEARSWYQRGYDVWLELRKRGTTTGDEAARPDDLAHDIARCDAALATLKATPTLAKESR